MTPDDSDVREVDMPDFNRQLENLRFLAEMAQRTNMEMSDLLLKSSRLSVRQAWLNVASTVLAFVSGIFFARAFL